MKIEALLRDFDKDYIAVRGTSGMSIFSYILQAFGVSDEARCEALMAVSVKLKELLKSGQQIAVYREAELMSDVTNLMYTIISKLHNLGINKAVKYMNDLEDPTNLADAKESLMALQEMSSPGMVGIFKSLIDFNSPLDYIPLARFENDNLVYHASILGGAVNADGLRSIGICYTTSAEDVKNVAPGYIQSKGKLLPLVIIPNDANPFAAALGDSGGVRSMSMDISIPVVRSR